MQVGNFISYGVCKFICLSSFMYNRFHKELRFFFSLLKRKKEAKKEKSSHSTCTVRQCITRRLYKRFSPTKIPRRGEQAAAAAVTLPFSQLKLGRKVSGDSPQKALHRRFVLPCRAFVFSVGFMPANSFVKALRINWFPTREYTAGAGYISRSSGSAAGSAAAEQRCPRSGDRAKPSASEKSVRSSGRLPRVLPVHSPPRPF